MHYYAEAGIPWYLVVDTKARALRLYRLDGTSYLEEARCEDGGSLRLTDPVAATIDLAELFPAH